MKISHLGNNIQTIRKFRGMKQQELADKIGINMQSLSKIERGLNYPAYDTLEKIMEVLDVTPNQQHAGADLDADEVHMHTIPVAIPMITCFFVFACL